MSELGRREAALAAAEEATEIYRELAKSRPDAFLPDLAVSLNNLGNRLSDLGRREAALAAAEEATKLSAVILPSLVLTNSYLTWQGASTISGPC